MNKAVFFDRDGIINKDVGIITSFTHMQVLDGIGEVVAYFRSLNYKTFIVTNQAVVARGLLKETELADLHINLQQQLLNINPKAIFDDIAYCPHHPNADLIEYRVDCTCRKPKAGMFFSLAEKHSVNLQKSYMIGDRLSDVLAGMNAGCKTVQCLTGKHIDEPIQSSTLVDYTDIKADYEFNDIKSLKGLLV